jgi:hypothetical protein
VKLELAWGGTLPSDLSLGFFIKMKNRKGGRGDFEQRLAWVVPHSTPHLKASLINEKAHFLLKAE